MKNIKTSIGVLFLTYSGFAGDSRVYNEDMGKRMNEQIRMSNVRGITGYTFNYTAGILNKESYKSSVEVFDRSGNKSEDAVYMKDGETTSSYLYTHNEEGIELKNVGIELHKPVYNNWSYEIVDSLSALKKYHTDGKSKEYWLTQYDESGRKTREYYYAHDGILDYTKELKYDKTGRLSEKFQYDSYGNLYTRWSYIYDVSGSITSVIQYEPKGNVFQTTSFSYDNKNNVSTSTLTDHTGKYISMTVYMYDYY